MSEPAATAAGIALYPTAGGGAISGGSTVTVGGAVQILTIFGVSLGLRPDFLVAGMLGAIASIFLLNSVPLVGDGFLARLSNMLQCFSVVLSSSVTAGYLAPLVASAAQFGVESSLATAFLVGACARIVLQAYIKRVRSTLNHGGKAKTGQDGEQE